MENTVAPKDHLRDLSGTIAALLAELSDTELAEQTEYYRAMRGGTDGQASYRWGTLLSIANNEREKRSAE